ncbi:MAG TPA: choice-of-anchor D domain-containing protein [Kofleriaceae bacterium]|nr:choice-of-anchor D domain-containing protein [Kofleriaceae bacterium]
MTINVAHNDPEKSTPLAIAVTGRGVAPQISAPATLPFGNIEVSAMSTAQDLVVTNTGTADLVISNATLTSGGANYVVMAGTTGSQMTTVAPGATASWTLVCTPQTLGSQPGNFRIVSNSFTQSTVNVPLSCTGLAGVLSITGSPIDFGNVQIGTVVTRTFTLSNTGNLAVTNIAAVVNPPNVGYSIDPAGNPVPASLAAGASVVLTVRFAPTLTTDGGAATITFTGDWGTTVKQTTAVLQLSGTPRTASYDLSTMMIDFGNLRFDATLDRTFCILNTGQLSITITNPLDIVPAMGTVAGEFSVVRIRKPATCGGSSTTNLTLPQTLAVAELLEVTVRADPANRAGMMQATLTVNSSLTMNPTRTLTLKANSTTGAFTLSPAPMIDFGAVDVQGAPVSSSFTITNTGDGPLDLTSFARTADPEFTITLPPNTTLQPTQSVNIPVTYKPVLASPAGSEERVNVTHAIAGDIDGPASQTLVLQGRGIDRVLNFAATPTFPPTFRNPGADAPVRTVTIKNLGEAPLKVSAAMIGDVSGAWQLVNAPTTTLTLGKDATQDFMVRFAPMAAGPSQAKLVITNDDSDRPMASVDLVGTGVNRNVQLGSGGPQGINLGFTGVGVPVTIAGALVVTSMDMMNNTFTIRDIELDQDSPFQLEGFTPGLELAPGAERTFGITFTSPREGMFTAKARLYLDEDPLVQQEVTLTGTAVFVDAHGGGGCAAGGSRGAAGTAGLVLAALLGLRRRRPAPRRKPATAAATTITITAAAALLLLAPGAASADDIVLSVFDPAPATVSNGFQLQSPEVGKSGDWAMSAVLSHATDPLTLDGSLGGDAITSFAVITRSTAANVGAAFAFLGRFEIGARMPFYLQDGQPAGNPKTEFTSRPAEGNARGDLAVHAKLQLTRRRLEGDGVFAAGLVGQVTLPTATRDQFTGLEDPSGRLLLLGSLLPGAFEKRITLTMNLGAMLRAPATYANLEQKSGIAWGLGLQVRTLDALWLAAEVYGDTVLSGRTERADAMTHSSVLSPIEWLGGLRWKPDRRFTVGLAAGRGLTSAVGTPAFRGVFSLSVTPGAPELRPIRIPKPDGDADGDGLRDSVDRCPDKAEDQDLFDDTDGCPDADNDGDSIADAADKCPLEPEDKDGFSDADGCPDKDNDGDGVADAQDKCPMKPEDKDGYNDTDGCPDADNDRDGIADAADKCPAAAETINGNQDDDGCPDKGDSLVVLSPDRLELLEAIQFTANQKIAKASQSLLGQIGATLRARTEIARLRITVHVNPSSDDDRDQETSDKRAAAVREWLVAWGVAPERLEVRGFGGTKPVVPPDRKNAAALNQRIELIILERK